MSTCKTRSLTAAVMLLVASVSVFTMPAQASVLWEFQYSGAQCSFYCVGGGGGLITGSFQADSALSGGGFVQNIVAGTIQVSIDGVAFTVTPLLAQDGSYNPMPAVSSVSTTLALNDFTFANLDYDNLFQITAGSMSAYIYDAFGAQIADYSTNPVHNSDPTVVWNLYKPIAEVPEPASLALLGLGLFGLGWSRRRQA